MPRNSDFFERGNLWKLAILAINEGFAGLLSEDLSLIAG